MIKKIKNVWNKCSLLSFYWIFRFEKLDRPNYELNTGKLRSLGFNFKSVEEMFDDCIASLVKQGHVTLQQGHGPI